MLELAVLSRSGRVEPLAFDVVELILGGYTARSKEVRDQHIEELRQIGVEPPDALPAFWHVSPRLLTTHPRLSVQGEDTSGEIEFILLFQDDAVYVGVASDQTDRALERFSIPRSKQVCGKVMGPTVVRLDEVHDIWDSLELSCEVRVDGQGWRPYQEAPLSEMLDPHTLQQYAFGSDSPLPGRALMSGTIPLVDGITRYAKQYRCTLRVPDFPEDIAFYYSVDVLPTIT